MIPLVAKTQNESGVFYLIIFQNMHCSNSYSMVCVCAFSKNYLSPPQLVLSQISLSILKRCSANG